MSLEIEIRNFSKGCQESWPAAAAPIALSKYSIENVVFLYIYILWFFSLIFILRRHSAAVAIQRCCCISFYTHLWRASERCSLWKTFLFRFSIICIAVVSVVVLESLPIAQMSATFSFESSTWSWAHIGHRIDMAIYICLCSIFFSNKYCWEVTNTCFPRYSFKVLRTIECLWIHNRIISAHFN